MEASAMAGVPLAGTNHTVGIDDYHHFKGDEEWLAHNIEVQR